MRPSHWIASAFALALVSGPVAEAAFAHGASADAAADADPSQQSLAASTAASRHVSAAAGVPDARAYFTDTRLQTQDGRRVQFYTDMLKDRVVLLNVMYASCKDACPLITRKLKEVREALGEPLARKVHFVSISSDPERDSPQALKAFATKNGASDSNWTFLTGDKQNVEFVLSRLGQLSTSPDGHSTLLIAGDVAAKRWSKIRPDASPVVIAERLKLLTEPRPSAAGGLGTGR